MTTTAEKIEKLRAGIEEAHTVLTVQFNTLQRLEKELVEIRVESLRKPADPEPLECWSNLYETLQEIESFLNKRAAELGANCGQPVRTVIHMREVTPQDEQDRLDAELWREHIKVVKANI